MIITEIFKLEVSTVIGRDTFYLL